MDILENKTNNELHDSLLAEIAKSSNEIKCAQRDINKALGRLQFAVLALNELINRGKD